MATRKSSLAAFGCGGVNGAQCRNGGIRMKLRVCLQFVSDVGLWEGTSLGHRAHSVDGGPLSSNHPTPTEFSWLQMKSCFQLKLLIKKLKEMFAIGALWLDQFDLVFYHCVEFCPALEILKEWIDCPLFR